MTLKIMSTLAFILIFIFIGAASSIALEMIGMKFWWPEMGEQHAVQSLQAELSYLGDGAGSFFVENPQAWAKELSENLFRVFFVDSGMISRLQSNQSSWVHNLIPYLVAAMITVQVFFVRLCIITLAMPMLILFMFYGIVKGLAMRDVRRWCGGREHSRVFHRAQNFVIPTLGTSWVIYLSNPESVHPAYIVLPLGIISAGAMMLMFATYKKYV